MGAANIDAAKLRSDARGEDTPATKTASKPKTVIGTINGSANKFATIEYVEKPFCNSSRTGKHMICAAKLTETPRVSQLGKPENLRVRLAAIAGATTRIPMQASADSKKP